MFRWLNKQGVESDEGYSLQVVDRFNLAYTQTDGRSISIKMEIGLTAGMKPCVIVDQSSLFFWNNQEKLAETDVELVKGRLASALKFQNMELEFHS